MRASCIPFHVRATALFAGLALSCAAHATQYAVTDIGLLGPNLHMWATGLNASGQVIGYAYDGTRVEGINLPGSFPTTLGHAFVTGANGQGLTALDTLAGDTWSRPTAINASGQVVGTSGNGGTDTHAFITTPAGQVRSLGSLGGSSSSANAINASGQVGGSSTDANGMQVAYLTAPQGGAMQRIDTGAPVLYEYPRVMGVNTAGQVAGDFAPPLNSSQHTGFVSGSQGSPVTLITNPNPVPGGYSASLFSVKGINDRGQVVGTASAYIGGATQAYLRDVDGTIKELDLSHAPHYLAGREGGFGQYGPRTLVFAKGLNGSGQVVGEFDYTGLGAGVTHAFITDANGANPTELESLAFTNFNVTPGSGFFFTSATGINDLGSFVANASNGHAYLISVVPEPASGFLMLVGVVSLGWLRTRRPS